jgi:hypothetical protein
MPGLRIRASKEEFGIIESPSCAGSQESLIKNYE